MPRSKKRRRKAAIQAVRAAYRDAKASGELTPALVAMNWTAQDGGRLDDPGEEDGRRDATDVLLDEKGFNLKAVRSIKLRLELSDIEGVLIDIWHILHAHAAPRVPPAMLEPCKHGYRLNAQAGPAEIALVSGEKGALVYGARAGAAGDAGAGGAPPKPLRARIDGWTAAKTTKFLGELSRTGLLGDSAKAAGISRTSVTRRRKRDPAFERQVQQARQEATPALEAAAFHRAVEGVDEPILYAGEIVAYRKKYSDPLLRQLIARLDEQAAKVDGGAPGVLTHDEWRAGWRFDSDGSKFKEDEYANVRAALDAQLDLMRERLTDRKAERRKAKRDKAGQDKTATAEAEPEA